MNTQEKQIWDLQCKLNDKTKEMKETEMDWIEQLSIKEDEYQALIIENETYEKRREKRLNETEILVEDLQEENKKLKEENEAFRLQDKYLQQRIELTWLEELKKPSPWESERNGKNKFAKPINTPHAFCELNVHYQALKKDYNQLKQGTCYEMCKYCRIHYPSQVIETALFFVKKDLWCCEDCCEENHKDIWLSWGNEE